MTKTGVPLRKIGDEKILVPPGSLPRFAGPAVTPVATARIFPAGAERLRKQTSVFCILLL